MILLNVDFLKKRSYKVKDKWEIFKDDEFFYGEYWKSIKYLLFDFMYGVNVLFYNVEEIYRK